MVHSDNTFVFQSLLKDEVPVPTLTIPFPFLFPELPLTIPFPSVFPQPALTIPFPAHKIPYKLAPKVTNNMLKYSLFALLFHF